MTSAAILGGEPYMAGVNLLGWGVGDDYRALARARGGTVCPRETDRPLTLTMMMERDREPLPLHRCTIPRELTPAAIEEKQRKARATRQAYYDTHRAQRLEWQRQYRQRHSRHPLTLTNPVATMEAVTT